jgi:hypothetical protein
MKTGHPQSWPPDGKFLVYDDRRVAFREDTMSAIIRARSSHAVMMSLPSSLLHIILIGTFVAVITLQYAWRKTTLARELLLGLAAALLLIAEQDCHDHHRTADDSCSDAHCHCVIFHWIPSFSSIAKSEVVLVLSRPSRAMRAVFHCDEFMVWPRAPNPIVSPGWLAPDRSPTSGRIALAPLP